VIELMESNSWVDLDIELPLDLIERLRACAAYYGRTLGEQLVYEVMTGNLLPPPRTH
jgi:hypothetical protein